ncbi:MAG: hypothetical protein ACOYWZ_04450 [Bacillota bacterium]
MTTFEIVKEYLEKNGYDGLYNGDCGCNLDDFMPCEGFSSECSAGYYQDCQQCDEKDCPIKKAGDRCIGVKG